MQDPGGQWAGPPGMERQGELPHPISLVPRPAPFMVTRKLSQGLGFKVTCARPRVER